MREDVFVADHSERRAPGNPRQDARELCAALGYGDMKIATALNGDFVAAASRAQTPIGPQDRIEIVAPEARRVTMLEFYGESFASRMILGSALYPSPDMFRQSVKAAGAELVTVSVRREGARERDRGSISGRWCSRSASACCPTPPAAAPRRRRSLRR